MSIDEEIAKLLDKEVEYKRMEDEANRRRKQDKERVVELLREKHPLVWVIQAWPEDRKAYIECYLTSKEKAKSLIGNGKYTYSSKGYGRSGEYKIFAMESIDVFDENMLKLDKLEYSLKND